MIENQRRVIKTPFFLVGMVLLLSLSPVNAQQNLVQNGNFDEGLTVWDWTYNFGIAGGVPYAPVGVDFGMVYGTLSQNLPTVPGQSYQFQFAMAGNPNDSSIAVLDVFWGGQTIAVTSWNPAGHSYNNNLGWEWFDMNVTASTSSTVLAFDNPNVGSEDIPYLDGISVEAVPEPGCVWLFSFGLAAIFVRRKNSN
jgi:hypothetical protein